MRVVHDLPALAPFRGGSFVPTMGALHAGHEALIRAAAGTGGPVVVSIFVNPTQFNVRSDLDRYPRTLEADTARCAHAGADAVFAPDEATVYPPGQPVDVPPLPPVATTPGLEDAHRPGHFAGVCQVVARLFDLVQPARAHFGEKDWQQLKVIEAMAASHPARWPGLCIVPCPTVRESDGLALSSRNVFLDPSQRLRAKALSRALFEAREMASEGRDGRRVEEHMRATLVRHGLNVEYAAVRDALTLLPVNRTEVHRPARGLIAATIGSVRLIDNMRMGIPPEA